MSTRLWNALYWGVAPLLNKTVGERGNPKVEWLGEVTEAEFRCIDNVGMKTLADARRAMEAKGVEWKKPDKK